MILLPSRSYFVVFSTMIALVATPAAGLAAPMSITSPANHVELVPNSSLNIRYLAECPADKACGSWQDYNVFNNVSFDLTHATIEDRSDVLGDTSSSIPLPSSSTSFRLEDMLTAGPWKLTSEWSECPITPNSYDQLEYAECTHQVLVRDLHVRPQVGTKDTPPIPQVWATRRSPNVAISSLYFMCNAPAAAYRIDYSSHKRVKVKGRFRWVAHGRTVRNVRAATDPAARDRCVVKRTHAMPRSLGSTQVRTQFVVRSVGYEPGARVRTISTRLYTRALLQSGGGVTIN